MLSSKELAENREKPPPELPTFGVKDFEPDGSLEQSYQIEHSISEIRNVIGHERVKLLNTLSKAVWRPELNLAEVTQQTGSYWSYMGHKIDEKLYIYPEEALYLLETGSIQIIFNEVPVSIERAYFVLLQADSNITLEKYRVYSFLNSHGYKVLRHSPQKSVTNYEKKLEVHKLGLKLKSYNKGETSVKRPKDSSESDIKTFKKVKMVHDTDTNLVFDFDLYSESSNKLPFKKSCLQLPDYRVVIHKGEDPMPNFNELCKISNKYKDEIPVIHAIVFFDSISFYEINPVVLPDVES